MCRLGIACSKCHPKEQKLKNNLKYHPKEQKTNNRYSEGAEAKQLLVKLVTFV